MIIRPSEWRADAVSRSAAAPCAQCGAVMAESNAKALAWLLTSVCDACADEMMAEMDEYDGPTEAPPPSPTASIIAFPVPTEPASGPRRARR